MADPDGVATVQGTVAMRGAVVPRNDPDALVAEIERTRENLARTIDTLEDRVSPAKNARRLRARVEEQAARPEVRLAAAAIGFAVVSLTVYRLFVRRRK
jgi:Protein of unknown function (DUF3618)